MHDDDDDREGPSAEDLERFGGETRPCPSCRREIYDESPFCPRCGHALGASDEPAARPPVWMLVAAAAALGAILFIAFR